MQKSSGLGCWGVGVFGVRVLGCLGLGFRVRVLGFSFQAFRALGLQGILTLAKCLPPLGMREGIPEAQAAHRDKGWPVGGACGANLGLHGFQGRGFRVF